MPMITAVGGSTLPANTIESCRKRMAKNSASQTNRDSPTADAAREFMEAQRWPDGAEYPHCGIIGEAYKLTADLQNKKAKVHARKGLWKCGACREQFTVTVGTIMEDSHIPLN